MVIHFYKFNSMNDYTNWDKHSEPKKKSRINSIRIVDKRRGIQL